MNCFIEDRACYKGDLIVNFLQLKVHVHSIQSVAWSDLFHDRKRTLSLLSSIFTFPLFEFFTA